MRQGIIVKLTLPAKFKAQVEYNKNRFLRKNYKYLFLYLLSLLFLFVFKFKAGTARIFFPRQSLKVFCFRIKLSDSIFFLLGHSPIVKLRPKK